MKIPDKNRYAALWQNEAAGHSFDKDKLIDSAGKLTIDLINETSGKLTVCFEYVLCYRCMDEGEAIATLSYIAASAGNGKTFYEVMQSDFLDWFHNESQGIWQERGVRHFVITTINNVIDVLATDPPMIK